MINNIKVSFDFDGTLDKPRVQKFAQDLLLSGYDVFITTQRKEPKLAPRYHGTMIYLKYQIQ